MLLCLSLSKALRHLYLKAVRCSAFVVQAPRETLAIRARARRGDRCRDRWLLFTECTYNTTRSRQSRNGRSQRGQARRCFTGSSGAEHALNWSSGLLTREVRSENSTSVRSSRHDDDLHKYREGCFVVRNPCLTLADRERGCVQDLLHCAT